MPCFKIFTNLTKDDIPKDFVNNIIPVLAKVVRKPASKFVCILIADCQVSFGKISTSPGAIASLESIGHVSPEDNKQIIKEVTEYVVQELGITPERFFISFYDLKATSIGKGGIILSEVNYNGTL